MWIKGDRCPSRNCSYLLWTTGCVSACSVSLNLTVPSAHKARVGLKSAQSLLVVETPHALKSGSFPELCQTAMG